MLGRLVRGALASAVQQGQRCESIISGKSLLAELVSPSGAVLSPYSVALDTCGREQSSSPTSATDTLRVGSHALASTSYRCPSNVAGRESSSALPLATAGGLQLQQLRAFGYRPPKPRYQLPDSIATIVREKIQEHKRDAPVMPPPPTLEQRPMQLTSLRVGCIATKAGMTQEWDEHGVRVPLTVLWIDECQVVGLKRKAVHGYDAVMLGAGHKRQKCMSPSAAGFFLKAGLPFKKLVAEWRVSEDGLLPVGTLVGGGHWVAGQRVDVTGWTKYKGFQGVMKRWGFSGQPASHGVSLSHRAPGAIGNRADPGRVWKGKKLPGCMGDERRTVHNCLVYKVDAARNLVYVRGQVPGPVGRSVFLRDSRLAPPSLRATWGLPFPTAIPSPEAVAAAPAPGDVTALPDPAAVSVWRNPTDPYLMYREETDYFPIEWKKGE